MQECVICLDTLKPRNGKIHTTDCNHCFHVKCFKKLIDNKCPCCREVLPDTKKRITDVITATRLEWKEEKLIGNQMITEMKEAIKLAKEAIKLVKETITSVHDVNESSLLMSVFMLKRQLEREIHNMTEAKSKIAFMNEHYTYKIKTQKDKLSLLKGK